MPLTPDRTCAVKLQPPSPDLTAAIVRHIASYASDLDSPYHQLAADHRVLGLYRGWGTDFGLTPDGSVQRFNAEFPLNLNGHDVWYGHPEMDATAIAFGSLRHPELRALFPLRPENAVDCESCDGIGFLTLKGKSVICACHGVGWRTPIP